MRLVTLAAGAAARPRVSSSRAPMIRGKLIQLRPLAPAELEPFIALINDTDARGYYMATRLFEPQKLRDDFAKHAFITNAFTRLVIADLDDRMIGTIFHFTTRPYSTAREIGCRVFDHAVRGRGYGTEALRLLVRNLFDNLPINRLEWTCDPRNRASAQVAQKCGFRSEGVARGVYFAYGEHRDAEIFALLRDDWKRPNAAD
jgi:ribosomal-protein-alanine N-acetyltransferase